MCDKRASRSSPARNRTASVGYAWLGVGGADLHRGRRDSGGWCGRLAKEQCCSTRQACAAGGGHAWWQERQFWRHVRVMVAAS